MTALAPLPRADSASVRGHLEIDGVWKRFANGSLALQDVSLTCKPGEFVVVVGPSGCGKSTLLNIAAGMLHADRGTARIDGREITAPGPDRAVVFQEHGLFPWLTAAQNVGFGLKMRGMPREERESRIRQALEMVHLSHSGNKLIHELSGGMRQRVAIARALVLDPAVLLMDEPFAALDAQTRTLMHEQLQDLWASTRKTILFVTHSVGEAVRLADRVIVLHAHPGRVRKEIRIELAHPRDFDSRDVTEIARHVRTEIEDEVNRVNQAMAADYWKPEKPGDLADIAGDVGSGI
jgi:NitT/TauT family transport system ATP-binding protein